jgi:hypothetical protein
MSSGGVSNWETFGAHPVRRKSPTRIEADWKRRRAMAASYNRMLKNSLLFRPLKKAQMQGGDRKAE